MFYIGVKKLLILAADIFSLLLKHSTDDELFVLMKLVSVVPNIIMRKEGMFLFASIRSLILIFRRRSRRTRSGGHTFVLIFSRSAHDEQASGMKGRELNARRRKGSSWKLSHWYSGNLYFTVFPEAVKLHKADPKELLGEFESLSFLWLL